MTIWAFVLDKKVVVLGAIDQIVLLISLVRISRLCFYPGCHFLPEKDKRDSSEAKLMYSFGLNG